MRRLRFLSISLFLIVSTSSGCMIMDELDKSAALMPDSEKSKDSGNVGAEDTASRQSAMKDELIKQSKQWWNRATSIHPAGLDSNIVSCRLGDRTQFMPKDSCLVQGGKPSSVSG